MFQVLTQPATLYLVEERVSMTPRPSRQSIKTHLDALPLVEKRLVEEILNEKASQAAIHDLETHNSRIPVHVRMQAMAVANEVMLDFPDAGDGNVIISRDNIVEIAKKAALRGASQTLYDLGEVTLDARDIENMIYGTDGPNSDQPDIK